MKNISIIIGADICPTIDNIQYFENGDAVSLIGQDIFNIIQEADFRIFNLECPLTDNDTPIQKSGPNLRINTKTINGIKALNPSLLTLANNHIFDHGVKGLQSTIDVLKQNNIPYTGVESNEHILELHGIKIGIYACAETEFNSGVSVFDPLETPDNIFNLKQKCDFVIVLYHGGKEYYRYPSPLLQKRFRKMADKGASLVVAQHTHCIGCFEKYKDSTLVYGQGNFIYNDDEKEYINKSLLIKFNISGNDYSVEYIPVTKDDDKTQILEDFNNRSQQIKEKDFVENEYLKFAKKNINLYLDSLQGNTILHKVFRKLFKKNLSKIIYSKKDLLKIQNYIQCEAHNELLLTGVKNV